MSQVKYLILTQFKNILLIVFRLSFLFIFTLVEQNFIYFFFVYMTFLGEQFHVSSKEMLPYQSPKYQCSSTMIHWILPSQLPFPNGNQPQSEPAGLFSLVFVCSCALLFCSPTSIIHFTQSDIFPAMLSEKEIT